MTDSSAELRMLRAKAYGPGGELSDAELARLQELEGRGRNAAGEEERLRLPAVAQPVSSAAAAPPPTKQAEQAERAEASDVEASSETETPSRRRWPLIAGSVVATLGIGFGIGWAIWGWDTQSFMLTAAHGDERAELEEQFDPGTVVAVAEQDGVVVWRAEASQGEERCVIITAPEQTSSGCMSLDEIDEYGWPNVSITIPEGQERAGESLSAAILRAQTGDLVPYIQVWGPETYDWESQYTEAELTQLRQIESEGYAPQNLSVIGSDGDTSVFYEWAGQGLCVVAVLDGDVVEACTEDVASDLTLSATVGGIPTEYIITQSATRGPQLTIVRHPVTVDPETGEVIEPSPDDPMFDDFFTEEPSIDDKTRS